MEEYRLDGKFISCKVGASYLTWINLAEPTRPGLDVVLKSPKRRLRSLVLDPLIHSSPYTATTNSEDFDYSYQQGDMSIDHNVELNGLFQSPSRHSGFQINMDNSSPLSWDVTPSLTFEFDDEETDKSRVEMLIDTEDTRDAQNILEWSEMISSARYVLRPTQP
jgi:hypothetical protein